MTDVRLRRDKYSDIATPQLLPVFIEVYAEGLVAAHKAAQLRQGWGLGERGRTCSGSGPSSAGAARLDQTHVI